MFVAVLLLLYHTFCRSRNQIGEGVRLYLGALGAVCHCEPRFRVRWLPAAAIPGALRTIILHLKVPWGLLRRRGSPRNDKLYLSRRFPDTFQTPAWYTGRDRWSRPNSAQNKDAPVSDKCERYISYLLRLWQAADGDQVVWQASLENAQTGERRGFADLDALLNFLRQTTDTETKPSEQDKE